MTSFKYHITFLSCSPASPHIAPAFSLSSGVCDAVAIALHELLHHHGVRAPGSMAPVKMRTHSRHRDPTKVPPAGTSPTTCQLRSGPKA